jgi:hypothetical protein
MVIRKQKDLADCNWQMFMSPICGPPLFRLTTAREPPKILRIASVAFNKFEKEHVLFCGSIRFNSFRLITPTIYLILGRAQQVTALPVIENSSAGRRPVTNLCVFRDYKHARGRPRGDADAVDNTAHRRSSDASHQHQAYRRWRIRRRRPLG